MNVRTNRREFIYYAAALTISLHGNIGRAQTPIRGCCIVPDNASEALRMLFNTPPEKTKSVDWSKVLQRNSGISLHFEQELGRVLGDMSEKFGVVPGFAFYEDGESPNAVAIDRAVVSNTNGTIAFGRQLLHKQLNIDNRAISIAAICAHEFGHIYQYRAGFYEQIADKYPQHIIELQADFLAGVYLEHFEKMRPNISLQGVGRAWEDMGSSRFTEGSTHGTSAMRLDSIQGGYFWAQSHPDQTMYRAGSAGIDHVKKFA